MFNGGGVGTKAPPRCWSHDPPERSPRDSGETERRCGLPPTHARRRSQYDRPPSSPLGGLSFSGLEFLRRRLRKSASAMIFRNFSEMHSDVEKFDAARPNKHTKNPFSHKCGSNAHVPALAIAPHATSHLGVRHDGHVNGRDRTRTPVPSLPFFGLPVPMPRVSRQILKR